MRLARFLFLVLIAWLIGANANKLLAQPHNTGTVKGVLIDSLATDTIAGATVSIFTRTDTSLVSSAISNTDGSFSITQVRPGRFLLSVSFTGYETTYIPFVLSAQNGEFDFKKVQLTANPALLQNVVVTSSPVSVKGDTTEFNAANIKTIPNSTAEDLLKKIPGIEVEKDGSIKAQGEPVTRIFVDGKRFFGNDPKMATRNIPTELIDKIQIIDAQSDESIFNGFDDGERIKTINIITKKDKKKGVFGKATAATGTNGRFAAGASANRFNGDQQSSFVTQINNINSQNFSAQDFTGAQNGSGNSGGLSTSKAAGFNFNNTLGQNLEVNGSYFYNSVNQASIHNRFRETFVNGDSSLFNTYALKGQNDNANHRLNAQVTYKIDSFNTVMIKHESSLQHTAINNRSQSFTTRGKAVPLNSVNALSASATNGMRMDNSVLFRHKFGRSGRSVNVNLAYNLNNYDRDGQTFSQIDRPGRAVDTIDQINAQLRGGTSYSLQVSYVEPVSSTAVVEVSYRYSASENTSDQQTFRRIDAKDEYSLPITNLTNYFENNNAGHRVSASYKKQVNKFLNYSAGLGVQTSVVSSNNITRNSFIANNYTNLSPTLNVQYKRSRYANLRFVYRGNTRQPSITQLQDVINNSNVTNIRTGNPNLKQEFDHSFNLRYNAYKPKGGTNLTLTLNGSKIVNRIGNSYIINSSSDSIQVEGYTLVPGAQFTRPENLGGAFDIGGSANYSFPIVRNILNISLGSSLQYNRDVMAMNKMNSFIHKYAMGGTAKVTLSIDRQLDINFKSGTQVSKAVYENQPNRNGDFLRQVIGFEPTYISKSGWIFSNDIDYSMNRGQTAGFNQSAMLWNMSFGRLFLKKQQAEIKLSVFDLLNQNISIRRNIEVSYVEDLQDQVLNRYFLLSFTYNLKNFSKGGNRRSDRS